MKHLLVLFALLLGAVGIFLSIACLLTPEAFINEQFETGVLLATFIYGCIILILIIFILTQREEINKLKNNYYYNNYGRH